MDNIIYLWQNKSLKSDKNYKVINYIKSSNRWLNFYTFWHFLQ